MSKKTQEGGIMGFVHRQDWEDFFMKFLSVFLGIVITFSGNAYINRSRERKDVKAALKLVRDELAENIATMDSVSAQLIRERDAATYLREYIGRFEEVPRDSMRKYCNTPLSTNKANLSSEALELLKNSSLFQKIPDKELSLDIIRAYKASRAEADDVDFYYQKIEKLIDEASQQEVKAVFARKDFTGVEMWTAITSTEEGKYFLNEIIISSYFGLGQEEYKAHMRAVIKRIDNFIENY